MKGDKSNKRTFASVIWPYLKQKENKMIYCNVEEDNIGNLLVKPVSKKYSHLDMFLQSQGDVEEFLDYCTPYVRKALEEGYTVRVKLTDEYLEIMKDIYYQEQEDSLTERDIENICFNG